MNWMFTLILLIPYNFPKEIEPVYKIDEQTDYLLFEKINEYRAYYKLKTWIWNDTIYKVTKHHNDYQVKIKHISHYEEIDVPNFNLIYDLRQRFKFYNSNTVIAAENVAGGSSIIELEGSTPFKSFVRKISKVNLAEISPKERMLYFCLWLWDISPTHKEVLMSDKYCIGAVTISFIEPVVFEKSVFKNNKPVQQVRFFAVMNVGK